jgi:transcriptional regulator with XRE-family HTH domain
MASPVGTLMRHWRRERRMSQLNLATTAGVTQRHVSFVESGRAQPSRELVLHLARALDVPLRERNQLLLAAGYAPQYRETGLDQPALQQVQRALQRLLAQQEPHPAVVMDRHWDIQQANEAATSLFTRLLDGPPPTPANVIRLMFGPLRPHVANFEATADALLTRIYREAVGGIPDPKTQALLDEIRPDARPDFARIASPVVPVHFVKDDLDVSYFSLVTTVGTPQDVTLQEIRVELFFPAA